MVASNGHQLKRVDVEGEDEVADEEINEELPTVQSPHTLKQSNFAMTC